MPLSQPGSRCLVQLEPGQLVLCEGEGGRGVPFHPNSNWLHAGEASTREVLLEETFGEGNWHSGKINENTPKLGGMGGCDLFPRTPRTGNRRRVKAMKPGSRQIMMGLA